MSKRNDKQLLLSRRALVFGGLQAAGFSLLLGRLYQLQFIKSTEYRTLSENNRIKLQLIAPERGQILDRNGIALANNEKNYLLFLDTTGQRRSEVERLLERTRALITLSDKRANQAWEEYKSNPFASPLLVKEHLDWQEVASVELHQLELPQLYVSDGQVRAYPFGEHAAHLIGYVGAVDEKEIGREANEPLLRLPEYKIGKSGTEKMLEDRLRGMPGIKQLEVNVHGQIVRDLSTKESIPGETLRLTIDSRLQDFGASRFKDQSGAAIVMDVTNGDILSLISMPAYDPNIFSKGIPTEYWASLHDNDHNPLIDKSVQGQYPPGSTFKPMVAMAGLTTGTITPETHVHCPGYFMLGDHRFNCWKSDGHGSMNVVSALKQSCDTFFYTVARNTGIDDIAKICRMFGLGTTHLEGFPSEKPGLVPDVAWKQKRYKQRWTTGDTVNAGIGQGYVLATPFQLALMSARVATGKAVIPRLTYSVDEKAPPEFESLNLPDTDLKIVQQGMDAVVNLGGGTAYSKRIPEAKYAMAGKTGTAQVRRQEDPKAKNESMPWKDRHHALFIAYAPVTNPRYAAAAIIEHGGHGGTAAAPIIRDMLWKIQRLADGNNEDPPPLA